jgi:hypothetical protein
MTMMEKAAAAVGEAIPGGSAVATPLRLAIVRAVLLAVSWPDDHVVEAMRESGAFDNDIFHVPHRWIENAFVAGIEAILNEKPDSSSLKEG